MANQMTGPWSVESSRAWKIMREGLLIAEVPRRDGMGITDHANAILIAAAPDQLEALEALLAYRNENTAVHSGSLVWDDVVLPAISKARGL